MTDSMPDKGISISLPEFFSGFGYSPEETIYFRRIREQGGKDAMQMERKLEDLPSIVPSLKRFNSENYGIFFVVNGYGNEDAKVLNKGHARAQFMECDDKSFSDQWQVIHAFPLEPSVIVKTRKSLHTYWLLENGDIKRFRTIQKRLAEYFGSDSSIENESRVMRVPNFNHCKSEPVAVEVVHWKPELRYTQDQLEQYLPEMREAETRTSTQR